MFNHKYLLHVFLITALGGCSQALFAAAETGPARDMSPEEWARFIQGLPRGVDVLPLQLAEPTCADVGMTTRDAGAKMFITVPGRPIRGVGRSVAEINIEPSDTWLTFKNKISAATGIPVDRISIVSQARKINQLAPLSGWQGQNNGFVQVIDTRGIR
ncbi:MAG: hypothetical protein NT124_04590 [Candidatus Dependentiae bacterium]|nr:hypothetical protein [Candidatus Dependentiae bacterium]